MERRVGEIFKDGEVTLKTELGKSCDGCYYCGNRDDDNDVIFVKQNQNDRTK